MFKIISHFDKWNVLYTSKLADSELKNYMPSSENAEIFQSVLLASHASKIPTRPNEIFLITSNSSIALQVAAFLEARSGKSMRQLVKNGHRDVGFIEDCEVIDRILQKQVNQNPKPNVWSLIKVYQLSIIILFIGTLVTYLYSYGQLNMPTKLAIPVGVVAAFDLPNGCPVGWKEMPELNGRMIVGASPKSDQSKNLSTRSFRETGGEENHRVSLEEMPAHRHGLPEQVVVSFPSKNTIQLRQSGPGTSFDYISDASEDRDKTVSSGAGRKHNNMPPFLALHYCKKTQSIDLP